MATTCRQIICTWLAGVCMAAINQLLPRVHPNTGVCAIAAELAFPPAFLWFGVTADVIKLREMLKLKATVEQCLPGAFGHDAKALYGWHSYGLDALPRINHRSMKTQLLPVLVSVLEASLVLDHGCAGWL